MVSRVKTLNSVDFKTLVRIAAGGLILAAAVYLQYRLANIPTKVDAAFVKDYSVKLGEHELALVNPIVGSSPNAAAVTEFKTHVDGLLLSHVGNENEIVAAHFHNATFSDGSRDFITKLVKLFPPNLKVGPPPVGPAEIRYNFKAASDDDRLRPNRRQTCQTNVHIYLKATSDQLSELFLFQREEAGSSHYSPFRDLWIRAKGAQLIVGMITDRPPPDPDSRAAGSDALESDVLNSPDCRKSLGAGKWELGLPGGTPVEVTVPEGEEFHFMFGPWDDKATNVILQPDFQPFEFCTSPLWATGLRIQRSQSSSIPLSLLPCWMTSWPFHCSERETPFAFSELRVGPAELHINASGEGFAKLDGKYKTRDLFEWAKNNPLLVLLTASMNTALLGFLKKKLFGKPADVPPLVYDDD